MARRSSRREGGIGRGQGPDGDGDELSAPVVRSLLEDGYGAEEIAAFYDLPVRRVRRFMRRHGLDGATDTTDVTLVPTRADERDPWDDEQFSPTRMPAMRGTSMAGRSGRTAGRRLSTAQIDELCTLYLDPSLSIGEVAAYFDLDPEAALALIDERLKGIVPHDA